MNDAGMKTNQKSGFSLIEVMVAILLLLVLVVGAFMQVSQSGSSIQRMQNTREALIAAEQVMDTYWSLNYDDLESKAGNTENQNVTVNGISMAVQSTFSTGTDSLGIDYVQVAVDINHFGSQDDAIITTRRYAQGFSRAEL